MLLRDGVVEGGCCCVTVLLRVDVVAWQCC